MDEPIDVPSVIPRRIESAECSICGRTRTVQTCLAKLGGPWTYLWCDECREAQALPEDYVEFRMGPDWTNDVEIRGAIQETRWARWTVWTEGRYVPLDEFLRAKVEEARRRRERPD